MSYDRDVDDRDQDNYLHLIYQELTKQTVLLELLYLELQKLNGTTTTQPPPPKPVATKLVLTLGKPQLK